ncbi:MAG: BBP7 family outer membrane beta-barrel protein [Pirellulales bacterium]|nr:BBP7 family outer membrane beta-barrel protein [Pirellulales bacterium]
MRSQPRSVCVLISAWILSLLFPVFHAVADHPRRVENTTPKRVRWYPAGSKRKADVSSKHPSESSANTIQQASSQRDAETIPAVDGSGDQTFEPELEAESVLEEPSRFSAVTVSSLNDAAVGAACCGGERFWAKAEYLYWHTRGMSLPALVTTSAAGTVQDDAGVLGISTTSVIHGNERIVDDGISGGRLQLGGWLNHGRTVGFDFIYTGLGDQDESLVASSTAFPILARPFLNVDSGQQDSRLLGFPNVVSGNVAIDATTEYQVLELLVRRAISQDWPTPTSFVYGYRFSELEDSLIINDFSTSLAGATAGATVAITDEFRSRNTFHGFEVGLLTDFQLSSCWQVSLAGKVAFGETDSVTTIRGRTVSTNATGDVTTTSGGLLTQNTNIGRFETNSHGVQQDLSISLRRYLECGVTLNVGYGIHRWIDVARSGEQIDLAVNPTQIPPGTLTGDARPQFLDAKSDFIAQGLTLGLEYFW